MNETSLPSNAPNKRRSWLQFGTRTLFVLIVITALAAWWLRGEMLKEQRREELIAVFQEKGSFFSLEPKATWRRRLGAWLRGKPHTPAVRGTWIAQTVDLPLLREFVELFPEAPLSIGVTATRLSPQMQEFLAQLKSIDSLKFVGPIDPTEEFVAWLARLPIKRSLEFSVNRLDDELLRRLADAKVNIFRIEDLSESTDETEGWSQVTDDGLKAASRLRILRYICAGRKGSDDGVAAFEDIPALAFVELIGPGYTDASAETLAKLSNMMVLTLTDTKLTDAGIAQILRNGRKIRDLRLGNTELGEESIAAIAGMPALTRIQFRGVPLSAELAAALGKLSLQSLTLQGDYTDADVGLFAPIAPSLTVISIKTPNVTDRGLTWLAGAGKLRSLQLFDTQVTAATIKLIKCPSAHVYLGGPNICAATLPQANRSFKLGVVRLLGSSIDDETLSLLEPPYDGLELVGTRVTAAGLRSLKTDGKAMTVSIWFDENTPPPLTQQEIDEIKQATTGLVTVSLTPVRPALFESQQPASSRKPSAEAVSP